MERPNRYKGKFTWRSHEVLKRLQEIERKQSALDKDMRDLMQLLKGALIHEHEP